MPNPDYMNGTAVPAAEPVPLGVSPDSKFTTLSKISADQIELLECLRRITGDLEHLTLHMGRPSGPTKVSEDSECLAPFDVQKDVLRECFREVHKTQDMLAFLSEVLS